MKNQYDFLYYLKNTGVLVPGDHPAAQESWRQARSELEQGFPKGKTAFLHGFRGELTPLGFSGGGSQMGKCRDGLQQREHALDCYVPALALVLRD